MVWSNLALQWCNDLPATFVELQRVLKVDGLLMFSSFGVDTLQELRTAFHDVDGYNHVNRFADMHDIGDMLVAAGFADPVMEMERITLTYNDVRAVMQDLKSIGAHNATAGRAPGMMGKAAWRRVMENYEKLAPRRQAARDLRDRLRSCVETCAEGDSGWARDHQDGLQAMSYFVTGTDTGVGKTLVSCALLHAFCRAGQTRGRIQAGGGGLR